MAKFISVANCIIPKIHVALSHKKPDLTKWMENLEEKKDYSIWYIESCQV